MTAYAEVIGDPIVQSKSPAIHKFWLGQLGLPHDYRAAHVTRTGLTDYIASRRSDPDWRGCNVTMPHKQAVMPLLDAIDPQAARIGAVNTVVRGVDGRLIGYNTDVAGFLEPLAPILAQPHHFRMARILGAGGAARAIISALTDKGFVLVVAARDPANARALLDELATGTDHHAVDLAHFAPATDFAFDDREGLLDLIINASPLGMAGQPPLEFDFSHAPPGSVIYDIVTHPLDTPLLIEARRRGFATIDGLAMLIGQAAAAFEKFFGVAPPRGRDAELRRMLTQ
ncbi:MAG: Shikimate dehydrogenase [Pseudomonadota bacterium]|jgi:shikimate dehydrogenase